MMYSSNEKMKDNMNPKRMTKSYGGGAMPTPARTKANMVVRMIAIRKVGQLNLTISLVKCTSVCLINCERRTTL
jgi:hypothetical protein